ncbi:hypothetical protein ACFVS2_21570 [Brevibacillus sp. NPDC058079]|uniref:hypothetical protein n=1 Tax=Brevibacillus sp. NPDC058079 TaxID=3346330 RepID=UPI0036E6AD78
MSQHIHSNDNEAFVAELQQTEKALKASEQLRFRAIANKDAYVTQLKENDAELKALGTTAEQAEKEVQAIDAEIENKFEKIKSMIPFDLLQKYNMLK